MSDTTPRMMRRFKQTLDSTKVLIAALLLLLVASPSHAETYFYHTDHLGTPQVLTNKNQTVVWQAALEPFGEVTEAVALVEQNLRFPGQYLDRESGLYYNYFRSYNSDTGRYTQSDPIGLYGGINTYGYAYQNPLKYTDPTGEIVPIIVWAWTAFEIASTAYDVYNAASTFADECSSTSDKLIAGSVLAAGVFLPGRYSFVTKGRGNLDHADDFDAARRKGFENAGMIDPDKVGFSKVDPKTGTIVEFKGEKGAKVAYDSPHADMNSANGHDMPHVGWQSGGKQPSGGHRGNITYNGPQHPSRPNRKP